MTFVRGAGDDPDAEVVLIVDDDRVHMIFLDLDGNPWFTWRHRQSFDRLPNRQRRSTRHTSLGRARRRTSRYQSRNLVRGLTTVPPWGDASDPMSYLPVVPAARRARVSG
ncbi:hypothetical protein V5P93_005683 [Actinokineospora auranticolor]|uniref:hypothetical protein n=1 Tax=Actinokineospora auranticolor TaxID=155976 RepID=UPI0011B06BD7|nr:hypothetical protein [Actinokineospora auranticolor]